MTDAHNDHSNLSEQAKKARELCGCAKCGGTEAMAKPEGSTQDPLYNITETCLATPLLLMLMFGQLAKLVLETRDEPPEDEKGSTEQ